jgi:hypothetical protein
MLTPGGATLPTGLPAAASTFRSHTARVRAPNAFDVRTSKALGIWTCVVVGDCHTSLAVVHLPCTLLDHDDWYP